MINKCNHCTIVIGEGVYFHCIIMSNLGQIQTTIGWSKNPLSSQIAKLMAGKKFSDYLGLKHYKKAKVVMKIEGIQAIFILNGQNPSNKHRIYQ